MSYENINFSPHFLDGENIYLRPLNYNDILGEYPTWLNDQQICAHNSHAVFPYTIENAYDFIKNLQVRTDSLVLAIVEKANDTHLGNVALQAINFINRSAELSILIGQSKSWGKGFGTEACKLLITHAVNSLNLRRIYFGTPASNESMIKIGKKLGMQKEGCRKEAFFKNGLYEDIIEYGLILKS